MDNTKHLKPFRRLTVVAAGLIITAACSNAPKSDNSSGGSASSGNSSSIAASGGTTRTVTGTADISMHLKGPAFRAPLIPGDGTNYYILAVSPEGSNFSTNLNSSGGFSLDLPTNYIYTLFIEGISGSKTNYTAIGFSDGTLSLPVGKGTNNDMSPVNIGNISSDPSNGLAKSDDTPRKYVHLDKDILQFTNSALTNDEQIVDSLGKGVPDFFGVVDSDGSGIPDVIKKIKGTTVFDSDNDGIPDSIDLFPNSSGTNGQSVFDISGNTNGGRITAMIAADSNVSLFKGHFKGFWTNKMVEFSLDENIAEFRGKYTNAWTNFVGDAAEIVLKGTNSGTRKLDSGDWSNYLVAISLDKDILSNVKASDLPDLSNAIADVSLGHEFSNKIPDRLKNEWSNSQVRVTLDPGFSNIIKDKPELEGDWSNKLTLITLNSNYSKLVPDDLKDDFTNKLVLIALDTNFEKNVPDELRKDWSNKVVMVTLDTNLKTKIPSELEGEYTNKLILISTNSNLTIPSDLLEEYSNKLKLISTNSNILKL